MVSLADGHGAPTLELAVSVSWKDLKIYIHTGFGCMRSSFSPAVFVDFEPQAIHFSLYIGLIQSGHNIPEILLIKVLIFLRLIKFYNVLEHSLNNTILHVFDSAPSECRW